MIIVLYDIIENLFPFNFYILFLVSFPPQLRRNELEEADFQQEMEIFFNIFFKFPQFYLFY